MTDTQYHTREADAGLEKRIDEKVWLGLQEDHHSQLGEILEPYLDKRSHGIEDPILDFLFEYYAFRPSALMRWSPGIGVRLAGDASKIDVPDRFLAEQPTYFEISAASFPQHRLAGTRWIKNLLDTTSERQPVFGCHGLHEWAMVYRSNKPRHAQLPLRLGKKATDEFVESQTIACSHFDAFRFFTDDARPLNRIQPTRHDIVQNEQPGCLHANMDLYKWTYKLYPFAPASLLFDAFVLARDIRVLDMQASPYDLSELDLQPVAIETENGRAEYRAKQQLFALRANGVRTRLRQFLTQFLEQTSSED